MKVIRIYRFSRAAGMIRRESLVQALGLSHRIHRYRGRSRWKASR